VTTTRCRRCVVSAMVLDTFSGCRARALAHQCNTLLSTSRASQPKRSVRLSTARGQPITHLDPQIAGIVESMDPGEKLTEIFFVVVSVNIAILQRKIPARDRFKSRHVTLTNTQCCPRGQH